MWYAVELLRGFFFQDDFVLLYLAGTVPLNDLLLRGYNGRRVWNFRSLALGWAVTVVLTVLSDLA